MTIHRVITSDFDLKNQEKSRVGTRILSENLAQERVSLSGPNATFIKRTFTRHSPANYPSQLDLKMVDLQDEPLALFSLLDEDLASKICALAPTFLNPCFKAPADKIFYLEHVETFVERPFALIAKLKNLVSPVARVLYTRLFDDEHILSRYEFDLLASLMTPSNFTSAAISLPRLEATPDWNTPWEGLSHSGANQRRAILRGVELAITLVVCSTGRFPVIAEDVDDMRRTQPNPIEDNLSLAQETPSEALSEMIRPLAFLFTPVFGIRGFDHTPDVFDIANTLASARFISQAAN